MEQAPAYREGIEDSIRRCEELLALSPLALETSTSGFRRSFSGKDQDAESSKECLGKVKEDERSSSSAEELWKRNMDLLISGIIKPHEMFCRDSEFQMDANKLQEGCLQNVMQTSQEPHENVAESSNNIAESKASGSHRSHVSPCQATISPEGSAAKSSSSFLKSSGNSGNKCEWDSEWSAASSEWITSTSCQDLYQTPESQFINSSQSSQKSTIDDKTCECLHVVLPLDAQSPTQSSISGLKSNKETNFGTKGRSHAVEVTMTRILNSSEDDLSNRTSPCIAESDMRESDSFAHGKQSLSSSPDHFHSSENEENASHCQSCQRESSSEVLQATTPEGSGISQIDLGVTWDAPDRFTSPESEQRIDTTNTSSLEQTAEPLNVHRQQPRRIGDERRSKSVPKDVFMVSNMPKYQRSKSVTKEHCEDRLQTLARPRTEVYKRLAELKAILEKEKLQQCSFKPLVGRRPDPESMHSAPIIERILELQQRFGLRKRARKAYEKEELDNCSFWPRINFRSQVYDKIAYQPIQDRFPELQRQKFEKIANAQLRMNIGLTFKPEINQKSIQLCKQKGLEMVNVAERLSTMQPSVHLDCKVEPQKNQITFAPEINKNTDYIISSSRQFKGCSVGFLKRQRQYMQTIEEKKKSKEHGTSSDLPFRPDIGNSVLILKQSQSQDVLQETPVERFKRLAYKDKEQLWHARLKASEDYYAQFHFQPEIDGFSRILARNNSVYDLYKNEKGRKVKEALELAAEYDFQQKCPFRPEVNLTMQRNDDSHLKNMIMQRRQLRKEKASCEQESRTLRELEALKECTFKPRVNRSPPMKETAPATIKGLERHLELQCIAKQMRREQEELERKVFFSHAYALPMRQYTIPRPFVLHTAQARYQKRV